MKLIISFLIMCALLSCGSDSKRKVEKSANDLDEMTDLSQDMDEFDDEENMDENSNPVEQDETDVTPDDEPEDEPDDENIDRTEQDSDDQPDSVEPDSDQEMEDEDSDEILDADSDDQSDEDGNLCRDIDGDGHFTFDAQECPEGDDVCDDPLDSHEFNWTKNGCDNCIDLDGDGYGENCDMGPDCNDNDSALHENCPVCEDADQDGKDGYIAVYCEEGTDHCDDDKNNWTVNGCENCVDADGDGRGTECDLGEDKCDDQPRAWVLVSCSVCADNDEDGYYVNCDDNDDVDYCDNNAHNWTQDGCNLCIDQDGDGRGSGCDLGDDACDDNKYGWTSNGCTNCVDADGDGYGEGCDMGLDACDDMFGVWTAEACETCVDYDGDGYGIDCDKGVDACDDNADNWTETGCASCVDADGDGYGVDCDKGIDCDDSAVTGASCHEKCPSFYEDKDGDGVGIYETADDRISRCFAPAGYEPVFGDCDDNATYGAACSEGCATYYKDSDGDGLGTNEIRGDYYSGCLRKGSEWSEHTSDNYYDCNDETILITRDCWRLTDNGDGTVSDSITGLMWNLTTAQASRSAAVQACEDLTVASYTDWRLPTEEELLSIYMAKYGTGGNYTGNGCHWNELIFGTEGCDVTWTSDDSLAKAVVVKFQFNAISSMSTLPALARIFHNVPHKHLTMI